MSQMTFLLHELEIHLLASRQALVFGDVAEIESLTNKQSSLQRVISDVWLQEVAVSAPAPKWSDETGTESSTPLLLSAQRILQLGKVQEFMIRRMQRHLRGMRNSSAGPRLTYSPRRGIASLL